MPDVIDRTALENAKIDADKLAEVMNQASGTVTLRLGVVVPSLAQVLDDLANTEIPPASPSEELDFLAETFEDQGEKDKLTWLLGTFDETAMGTTEWMLEAFDEEESRSSVDYLVENIGSRVALTPLGSGLAPALFTIKGDLTNNRVGLAILADGTLAAIPNRRFFMVPERVMVTPQTIGISLFFTDDEDKMLPVVYVEGGEDPGSPSVDYLDVTPFVVDGNVGVALDGSSFLLSFDGDVVGTELAEGQVRWAQRRGSAITQRRAELTMSATEKESARTKMKVIVGNGQSQESARNARPVINTDPVAPGKAMMFEAGVRPLGPQSTPEVDEEANYEGLQSLVNYYEKQDGTDGETRYGQFLKMYCTDIPADEFWVACTVGIGAQPYEQLCRGQAPFFNIAHYLGRLALGAAANDWEFDVAAWFWCQGGANSGDTFEQYYDKMVEYKGDLDELLDTMFEMSPRPIFMSQELHNTSNADMSVARAQLHFCLDTSDAYMTAPEYIFYSSHDWLTLHPGSGAPDDTTHIFALGQAWSGAYLDRAKRVLDDEEEWAPLHCTGASRSGAVVTLTFNSTDPTIELPLVLGGSHIQNTADGNWGIVYSDAGDGNSVSIDSMAVVGDDTIEITLTDTPTGTEQVIRIGMGETADSASTQGPITGARNGIRDSNSETVTIGGYELTMYNHCVCDIIPIT